MTFLSFNGLETGMYKTSYIYISDIFGLRAWVSCWKFAENVGPVMQEHENIVVKFNLIHEMWAKCCIQC